MLRIMLCGAHDTEEVSSAFTEIVQDFGADPWFYQLGKVRYINGATSRFSDNSKATVRKAHICVFVILDKYGDITWSHELQEALEVGKPFVVLALETAWRRYSNLMHSISDSDAITSPDDRRMVDIIRMINTEYQLTVAPFSYSSFGSVLRGQLSGLLAEGMEILQNQNQRASLIEALLDQTKLRTDQISQLKSLAADDYEENKLARKNALRRLAAEGVRDDEFVLELSKSLEQGVQRLLFDLIPDLLALPPSQDTVIELAQVSSRTDDVGIPRRLIDSVAKLDPVLLDLVLETMDTLEEGVQRRAYEAIESNSDTVLEAWGPERLRKFLEVCEGTSSGKTAWRKRLQAMREVLNANEKQ